MYEKVLYAALYEYISGLYFEHRFINALLIELSSLFYTLKSEKEIIASYPSMKTSILLSIEKINSSLEEMLISCNECHERPNTELLRLFSAGRSERKFGKCKDLNKEKEREIIKALKCRKAELELDRCQRSHTSLVREEIKDLNNRLFSIGREHRRRYFSSLFYYLRKLLISEREGYEALFQRIADCYEKLNDGTASKRKLRTTISPLLSLARKGGRKELMKAKLIYPMLIRTIEPDVIESDIRLLFESTPDAKVRGFKAGRFSFNVAGGRCEECKGAGIKVIEMNFLPSVNVICPECRGRRYKEDTLAVKYKGRNINDVLEMSISEAYAFFENIPSISQKLRALVEVGLGYVRLGQSAVTLSGGESQRMKLAAELGKKSTGNTLYILDEPTTGLHSEDIKVLLGVLQQLVDRGNTVIIIEHNLDVLKSVDYLIDMGPEGGKGGGTVVAQGTPEQIAGDRHSVTGPFLAEILGAVRQQDIPTGRDIRQ